MDGWVTELVGREVDRPHAERLVAAHEPERIAQAVAYFDAVPDGGPGLLVLAIREGRKPRARPQSAADSEQAYGQQIADWLREHFPQWNREHGDRTHPAAIACVIRLHHRYGKGRLSVGEHGAQIRAAVARFEAEYGSPGGEG